MLKNFLLNNWPDLIGTPQPEFLDFAVISSCNEEYGNDLVLIFVEGDRTPQFVLKVVRDKKYNFKLEREKFALVTLHNSASVKDFLPYSYSSGNMNGRYFFIQEGVSGKNLRNLLLASGLNEKIQGLLKQSILLLASINTAHYQIPDIQCPPEKSNFTLLRMQKEEFAALGIEQSDFSEIINSLCPFEALKRQFFLHGDFWPANILVDEKKGKINGVIDWEFSSPYALVPTDIVWFLITIADAEFGYSHSSMSLLESFKWGFFKSGEHNEIFKQYFKLYMSKIDLPEKKLFKTMLLITLADMAMREKKAYDHHGAMDDECLLLLKYALRHESYMDSF